MSRAVIEEKYDFQALSTAADIVTPTTESFLQLLKYVEGKIEHGSG